MDYQLLAFVYAADKKNFSRAAEELHITQSAVSLNIKALEKKYAVKLFDRTNKYVRLTKAGEILYYHARDILNQYAKIERLIEDLNHKAKGPLSIGSGYAFGEYLLPQIISVFKNQYPEITPKITIKNSNRIASQILRQELDLGIVEGDINHSNIVVRPFAEDEMVIIVPSYHRLAGMQEVDMEDLKDEVWVIREVGSGTREVTDRMFLQVGFKPSSLLEFGSSQIIKGAVEAGLGISFISEWVIRKEIHFGTLCSMRIKNHSIKRNFSYVTHTSKFHTKATDLFLDFLSNYSLEYDPGMNVK
jgi:DNA-binding transcriptional LysR family regulator